MRIRFSIFRDCKLQARRASYISDKCEVVAPISPASFNLCEEYANTFRTESYNDFWARVLDLTLAHGAALKSRESSSVAARLPSYRLFAEHLLDPDQPTVTKILAHVQRRCHPETHVLLSDYYAQTANASLLCSLLLKDIEQIRLRYRPLKATLNSLLSRSQSRLSLETIDHYLADLSKTLGSPLNSLDPSHSQVRAVQDGSADLLRRLESSRKKAKAKLRSINRLKRALAIFLIALTISSSALGVCVALHALVAFAALPIFLSASSGRLASTRGISRVLAQLDAATKGTYILNRELDTISRLVARLHDEVEHMLELFRLCCKRHDDRRQLTREVGRQIWKNDASFNQQLDELEEHLYLCFMTSNKARSLVMKEVLVARRV